MNKFLMVLISVGTFLTSYCFGQAEFKLSAWTGFYSGFVRSMPDSGAADTKVTYSQSLVFGTKIKINESLNARFDFLSPNVSTYYPKLRHCYTKWQINEKSYLLVGQTHVPLFVLKGNQQWDDWMMLLGYGSAFVGARGQIQYGYDKFKFALINPLEPGDGETPFAKIKSPAIWEKDKKNLLCIQDAIQEVQKDTFLISQTISANIPRFEASYNFNKGPITANAVAGFQMYSNDLTYRSTANGVKVNKTYTITTFAVCGDVDYTIGKAKISTAVTFAQNPYTYGLYIIPGFRKEAATRFDAVKGTVLNSTILSVPAIVSYTVNDKLVSEVGFGMTQLKAGYEKAESYLAMTYYANVSYNILPSLTVAPEIGFFNDGKDPAKQGKTNFAKIFYVAMETGFSF